MKKKKKHIHNYNREYEIVADENYNPIPRHTKYEMYCECGKRKP